MPVNKDADGRRSVEAAIEVPGAPEEVWAAIATGPGISSWFVPSEVDGREGGLAVSHFGPGNSMDSVATIKTWDPPRSFTAGTTEEPGAVATEWIVEAREGGTCIVRVVHRWFADSDEWDNQFEGHEQGWAAFFRILKAYLTHFPGAPSAVFQLMPIVAEPAAAAWDRLIAPLGFKGLVEGAAFATPAGVPKLAGTAESVGPPQIPVLLLRLDEPTPGLAHLFALPMGGQVFLPVRLYLYGPDAEAVAAEQEPIWQAWLAERFPSPPV